MVSALQDSKAPLPRPHPIVCMCHSAGPTRPSVCISFRGMGPHCPQEKDCCCTEPKRCGSLRCMCGHEQGLQGAPRGWC